ncbi:MAG: ABC transporter permease [Saprospiraceae bacterium]|nr:ABC transporter permease [Saprospiraceae bacterium]
MMAPPSWALRFLRWFCREDLIEEIEGDLYELFQDRMELDGLHHARRSFVWNVLRSFRLSTIRKINFYPMHLKSNFKLAGRHLVRDGMFSLIKIGGFALGVAACILIGLFVRYELSYDQHHPTKEEIYRIYGRFIADDGQVQAGIHFPMPLGTTIADEVSGIDAVGRVLRLGDRLFRSSASTQNIFEEQFAYIDQEIIDIFNWPFKYGDPKTALINPNTIILSEASADKHFPGRDPVGQTVIMDDREDQPLTVTGVLESAAGPSHLPYRFYISLRDQERWLNESIDWLSHNYFTYLKVPSSSDIQNVREQVLDIFVENMFPNWSRAQNKSIESIIQSTDLQLQPVEDIYLHSTELSYDRMPRSDIRVIWLFSAIALFILVIAIINFVNLATAKSLQRAREVGLRKVLGSVRQQLIGQFLIESFLFSLISVLLGVLLAWIAMPWFNELAGRNLRFPWQSWWLLPAILGGIAGVGLLAGLYPAFYLSRFKPMNVIRGLEVGRTKMSGLRSMLVIFQFMASIVLLIATFVIDRQMNYILNKSIGYDRDQIMVIEGTQTLTEIDPFADRLTQLAGISGVSVGGYIPVTGGNRNGNTFNIVGHPELKTAAQIWVVDHAYGDVLGLEMLDGRYFNEAIQGDSNALIINESMAKALNLDEPLGAEITNGFLDPWRVVGVVKDFHFASFEYEIGPLCLRLGFSNNRMMVKLGQEDVASMVSAVRREWELVSPNQSLRYTFLDENFARMFARVQQQKGMVRAFAFFAIIVACLGLFGLATYTTDQRSKEIGTRKVLGASSASIFKLLTGSFLRLVIIAFIIAAPLGWWLMKKWLEDYSYRIEMTWDILLYAGLLSILIVLMSISYQTLRATLEHPVKALRQG